jgi:hypothetical protein
VSSALAIGAVTAILRDLLNNGLIDHNLSGVLNGNFEVTVLSPDLITTNSGAPDVDRLNLFLYHVTPNLGWRNVGLPSRDAQGDRLSNPPLALDLHYLLTAYSKEPFHAEILLGYAMQLLHETPVLTRKAIRTALDPSPPLNGSILPKPFQDLSAADLAEQVEQLKICPMAMSTEEMSKLWTAFQTHYRPTAAYQISVVLIESRQSTKSALPVLERNIYVAPFQQPFIERVESSTGANQPIAIGSTLVIRGRQLKAEFTKIKLGRLEIDVLPAELSDTQITLPLPRLPAPQLNSLRAGVQAVQVVHELNLGTPADPHRGVESNVAAFVLQPTIAKNSSGNYIITTSGLQTDANGNKDGTITVNLKPAVGREQRVLLLLNAWNPPPVTAPPTQTYRFNAPSDNGINKITNPTQTTTDAIPFTIKGVVPGTYLVRVQVDGAESPLDINTNNRFTGTPQVTI